MPEIIFFAVGTIFLTILFSGVFYLMIQNLIGVPFVPSSSSRLVRALKESGFTPDKYPSLLDLGSGDGRIAIRAGLAGYKATGVETNPYLLVISRIFNKVLGNRAHLKYQDMYKADLSEHDIVYAYLLPKALDRLEAGFAQGNKPRVLVTNTFKLKGMEPNEVVDKIYYVYKLK